MAPAQAPALSAGADGRPPAVYAKLRNTVKDQDWNPEVEEEFEDSEGNVMNKKVGARGSGLRVRRGSRMRARPSRGADLLRSGAPGAAVAAGQRVG